jgi:hypothetical protein
VLQFLITNCGIDSVPGWDAPVLRLEGQTPSTPGGVARRFRWSWR